MHFWSHRVYLDYGPSSGPTLQKALCCTFPVGGAYDKYRLYEVQCVSNFKSSKTKEKKKQIQSN